MLYYDNDDYYPCYYDDDPECEDNYTWDFEEDDSWFDDCAEAYEEEYFNDWCALTD